MPLADIREISLAYGLNHYLVDGSLRAVLGSHRVDHGILEPLGAYTGREVYEAAYNGDLRANPILANWSITGDKIDLAILDPLERRVLEDLVTVYGVNRHPFEGRPWHLHYASLYLVADGGIGCILTITVQTAHAVYKYGGEHRSLYRGLAGIDEPLWGATWFTEVQGGSDLGANQTVAVESGGVWRLKGYKYFASGAGVADYALVTARMPDGGKGVRGLGLFLVPRLDSGGGLNYHVRRLKWKSGTRLVPTGEVELDGSEAYLIAGAGRGIYIALEDLMVSRLATGIGSLGLARKAYLEALLYSTRRRAFGKRIIDHPLQARDLMEMALSIDAGLAVAFKAVEEWNKAWLEEPPYTSVYHHARLLTHMMKNHASDISVSVTRQAVEAIGGIGTLHEYTVERWHREAMIMPVWEGTSNIQTLDLLEAMAKKGAHEAMLDDVRGLASEVGDSSIARRALEGIEYYVRRLGEDAAGGVWEAKHLLSRLADSYATLLLAWTSEKAGDPVFEEEARLYYSWRLDAGMPRPPADVLHSILSMHGGVELESGG